MSAPSVPLLEIRDLHVSYGHVHAVRGISLAVHAGQVVTLIGPNGAGKTSTLAAVAGLLRPGRGEVRLEGRDVTGLPAHRAVEQGIVLVPEGRSILARMSIEENLVLAAEARTPRPPAADRRAAIEAQYARFPVLGERRKMRADTLSGGERQQLAIGRALMCAPECLLLDEPSLGLAPLIVTQILELVSRLAKEANLAVLLVEQNAVTALRVASQGVVLNLGQVVMAGPAVDIASHEELRHAYLGY